MEMEENSKKRGRDVQEANKELLQKNSKRQYHNDESESAENYLGFGVFDFPWLKEGTFSKSEEWHFEDTFSISLHENVENSYITAAAAGDFSCQCLFETTEKEKCVDTHIPLDKFEEIVWWDCTTLGSMLAQDQHQEQEAA
ncbi:hypothetical protein JCGZ_16419 [Jatropha curcas]|uniref:Uncharacterized protein n=1 Tax=Jatropha curcas TaxID=180498 RepID=A0A067K9Q6_JATCU|nr:hypothetical protein JCGZ_16419 [Jatropha curcas]